MKFAIYARKSVYSDKSDSVDNQIRMCRDYIACRFDGAEISVYSDEDFTGANTDRPDLKRLVSDIGTIDALIVYQLDRLSRDVRDFSNIYAMLEEKGVMFISIKESIDTATPIGKAMMYVTVVFAQMERETIAERVTDNMVGLAKKGYWTGGRAPLGYDRVKITADGRQHVSLAVNADAEKVRDLYDTFLTGYTLSGLEAHFKRTGVHAPNGGFFSSTQIHQILKSPFACAATPEVYDYYAEKGCIMDDDRSLWNGLHGVMVYGRTTERNGSHQLAPPDKWHVCCGFHEPFLSADTWLSVQARFKGNQFCKASKYDPPLLRGVLRCKCGSSCGVSRKKKKDGVSSWYYCRRHARQGDCAGFRQIKCEILDDAVMDVFRSISVDRSQIEKYIASGQVADPAPIKSQIASYESKIRRLTSSLAACDDSAGAPYIREEIDRLALDVQALKRELAELASVPEDGRDIDKIADMISGLDSFTAAERNEIARECISVCVWNGEELFLRL